jgi:hypothetical protein
MTVTWAPSPGSAVEPDVFGSESRTAETTTTVATTATTTRAATSPRRTRRAMTARLTLRD